MILMPPKITTTCVTTKFETCVKVTLHKNGNDEETENSYDSYTSSSEETPDNTPKQVRSIISKKNLENKSIITLDQETNINSTN